MTTYRANDQEQRFYFRRGRTYPPSGPADSLIYLFEWRDMGASAKPWPNVATSTWSTIKLLGRGADMLVGNRDGRPIRLH